MDQWPQSHIFMGNFHSVQRSLVTQAISPEYGIPLLRGNGKTGFLMNFPLDPIDQARSLFELTLCNMYWIKNRFWKVMKIKE